MPFWHSKSLPTFLHEDNRAKYSNARLPNALKDCPLFSTYVHFLMEFSPISGRGPTPNLFFGNLANIFRKLKTFSSQEKLFFWNFVQLPNCIQFKNSKTQTSLHFKSFYQRWMLKWYNNNNNKGLLWENSIRCFQQI